MNARHAAALALVNWYLMVPQRVVSLGHLSIQANVADKSALCAWRREENPFDSEADCQAEKKALVDAYCDQRRLSGFDCQLNTAARCVRADDPRLIGWYLMVPPQFDGSAPLSRWHLFDTFDSADQCKVRRDQMGTAALCVAGNDPRLKAK